MATAVWQKLVSYRAFLITVRGKTNVAAITHQSLTCSSCMRGSVSVAHVDSFRSVDKNECWHTVASARQSCTLTITLFKLRIVKGYMVYFSYSKNLFLLLINVGATNRNKINCVAAFLLCWNSDLFQWTQIVCCHTWHST